MFAIILLLVILFLSYFLFFSRRKGLFLFRFLGLFFSFNILAFFFFNWILRVRYSMFWFLFLGALLVIFFVIKRKKSTFWDVKEIELGDSRRLFFLLAFCVLLGTTFFQYKLDEPRYDTPDPAAHFLYMSLTAKTGFLPIFLPNKIYPASDFNSAYKNHQETYPPGATVVFYFLDKVFKFNGGATTLQVFNLILYSLVVVYLLALISHSNFFRKQWQFWIAGFLLSMGAFFNLLTASHTTQLFSLFLLIFFTDVYFYEKNKITRIFLSGVALAAITLSYFYWLPVAALFALSKAFWDFYQEKKWKIFFWEMLSGFFSGLWGVFLSCGYIWVIYQTKILSYAKADGGFKYVDDFVYDQISLIIFLLVICFILLIKKKRFKLSEKEGYLVVFFLAAFVYFFGLFILWKLQLVSNYTRLKSLFLSVPLSTMVVLVGCLSVLSGIRRQLSTNKKKLFFLAGVGGLVVIFLFLKTPLFIASVFENLTRFFPLKKGALISRDQMILMQNIKKENSSAIKDGRILVLASYDTSLWVYALFDVWPRTKSLITEERPNKDVWSPMSVYSQGIFNYLDWLKNDDEHYLVFFDSRSSWEWAGNWGFDFSDYEVVQQTGSNFLLKLKDSQARYQVEVKERERDLPGEKKTISELDFLAKEDNLLGVSLIFDSSRFEYNRDYKAMLFVGKCEQNGAVIGGALIKKELVNEKNSGRFFELSFWDDSEYRKGNEFCLKLVDDNNDKVAAIVVNEDGTPFSRQSFLYKIR